MGPRTCASVVSGVIVRPLDVRNGPGSAAATVTA